MIDFKNPKYLKLRETEDTRHLASMQEYLAQGEAFRYVFVSVRDRIYFTNKRLIVVNVEGVTGAKKNITSLPYKKIQAFSIETAGVADIDSELQLWFSGLGPITFEFTCGKAIKNIMKLLGDYVL